MLRYALRRALWILPALLVTTLLFFGLIHLARLPSPHPSTSEIDLPLFVNPDPRDVRKLSYQALRDLEAEHDVQNAERLLSRLGGAALPHVLPQLEALDPEARGRVAMALRPVAERMGLATYDAFSSPPQAIAFWTRFWEERAIDFRPAVVRRAVRRQAVQDSPARRAALLELDTYALDGLMDALEPIHSQDDVSRAHRLLTIASHMTGKDPCVHVGMAPQEADRCIARWRDWWLLNRTDFEVLAGPNRIAAILTETLYGRWALQALTLHLGVGPDGVSVLERLHIKAPRTISLSLFSLLLAYGIAFPVALLSARFKQRPPDQATSFITIGLLALPVPILATTLVVLGGTTFALAAATTAMVMGLLTAPSRHQRLAAIEEIGRDWIHFGNANGIHPLRLLLVHVGRPTGAVALGLLALDFPLALSLAFVVEHVFHLDGLGPHVVRAVIDREVAFLMAFGLGATVLHALLLLGSDIAAGMLDPRLTRTMHGEG